MPKSIIGTDLALKLPVVIVSARGNLRENSSLKRGIFWGAGQSPLKVAAWVPRTCAQFVSLALDGKALSVFIIVRPVYRLFL
jgi:hypothetical protein